MQMQLGKIGKIAAAGGMAMLMAGATVGFAALSDLPAPFVDGPNADSLVVVGADAAPSDVVGAVDIAARLGGETTTSVSVGGAAASLSVSGEGRAVFTANERVFLDENLSKTGLRTAFTSTDMPTILASGEIQGTNTTYDYDLFFDFGPISNLDYLANDNVNTEDPEYAFVMGSTTNDTQFFARSRVVFTDELAQIDVHNDDVELFGGKYTVSSDSTDTKLVLFGSARTVILKEGESTTLEVDGQEREVTLVGVSDADTVVIEVDGRQESMDEGQSRTFGSIDAFIADVFFLSKETQISSAEIGLGARKLTFEDGNKVKVESGGTTDNIDGTFVVLKSSSGTISRLDVTYVGDDSTNDLLTAGQGFVDPTWGNVEVNFHSITTPLTDSTLRDEIRVRNSGTKEVEIRFMNDRGATASFDWAHITSSSDTTPDLADNNGDAIEVVENATLTENEFFIVDAGDFSRMFEVTDIDADGSSDADVTLRDVFTGDEITVRVGSDSQDEKVIDGQTYFFDASANTNGVTVTWGDGANFNRTGDFITVYPKLETRHGAEVALTTNVSVLAGNSSKIQLPTGAVTVDEDGETVFLIAANTEDGDASVLASQASNITTTDLFQLGRTSTGAQWFSVIGTPQADGSVRLNFTVATSSTNALTNPAVLIVEEQDDDNNVYSVVLEGATETRSGNEETTVGTIAMSDTGATSGVSLDSDSDIQHSVDKWGTLVVEDTEDQDEATVWYPDEQVSANVFVLGPDATVVSAGGGEAGTVEQAVPIKTPIGKLDTEVTSADRSTKNLILVGGPAVNDLVAELADAGKTRDLQWYRDEGEGTALVDLVEDAFTTGESALIVAGHSAADTRTAAAMVQNFDAQDWSDNRAVIKNGVITTATA